MGVVNTSPTVDKMRVAEQFSRHASEYVKQAKVQHRIAVEGLARASKWFAGRGECVVDLGCGVGHNLDALSEYAEKVIGVDIATGMVANNVSSHLIVQSDFDELSLPNASVDFVFSSMALQWSNSPMRVLSHIHRILKPGGRAMCAIMVSPSFVRLHEAFTAAGLPGRINEFAASSAWHSELFSECQLDEQVFVDEFDDFRAMMGSIKEIGASTVISQADVSPIGRAQYEHIIDGLEGDYSLDYRVCFLSLVK
ncbi:methyltransferase domain-containing protein [Alteromonas sp. LMIT006]|uniref:methyltransferase domain-containing protein n=1 Tax=Alteromonadaceae TaxID=72275 RepID=UPI0020CA2C2D|nr:methyltransferase domain-containing protein [Alteromonas sp. LMIT006]UTP71878.1 methyltransferase domain-containing protein [Alteromonas sp. LMIT006]